MASLYRLRLSTGSIIDLSVVESMSFGGELGVIVYESPGSNGGTVVTTGRKNKTVVLRGKLTGADINDINTKKMAIDRLRDNATVVNLDCPLDSEDTGRYIVGNFAGGVVQGTQRYVTFDMTLIEYRQANIQSTAIALVNFQPAELLKQRAKDRNILGA